MRFYTICCALTLILTACGGGDEDAGGSDTSAPATTTTTTTDTATTPAPPTTLGDPDDDDDMSPANCPELAQWAMESVSATQAAFAGGGPAGLDFTAEYFQEFADRAPAEIRDDMQIFADAFQAFFTELDNLGIDFTDPEQFTTLTEDDIEKLEAATAELDSEAVEQALNRIEAFFERECS